jgi:hypothetical protein
MRKEEGGMWKAERGKQIELKSGSKPSKLRETLLWAL